GGVARRSPGVMRRSLLAGAVLGLAACQSPAPQPPAGEPAATPAPVVDLAAGYARLRDSGAVVYRVDPARSDIRVYVYRGGRAAKLGHNHVLSVPAFEGYAVFDGSDLASARFDLGFRFDAL